MFNKIWHDIWIVMFVLLIIVGIVRGQGLVIGLGAMGLIVAGVSWVWNRLSPSCTLTERYIRIHEHTYMYMYVQYR